MATDLYILNQSPWNLAPARREIDHWFRLDPISDDLGGGYEGMVDPTAHQRVEVVIGDGDVLVRLSDGQTAQRSYEAITTCHLCKLDLSFPSPDDDPVNQRACVFCTGRKETYHRMAEMRVRHSIKTGYQHMYGPFNIDGSAPIPFPALGSASPEAIVEILADCQADVDFGQSKLKALRAQVIRDYRRMGGHHKTILVRKFGAGVFRDPELVKAGHEEGSNESKEGDASDEARLMGGESTLQSLRIDISLYRKILAEEKRMVRGRR